MPPPRVLLALIVGSAPMSAFAACPSPFGTTCAVGGTDVCTTSGGTFTCDVSTSDDSAECTVVSDYPGATQYEAWGFVRPDDGMGGYTQEVFCCASDPQNVPTAVVIEGSGYADLLQFTWDSLAYNLNGLASAITGTINGNAGNDILNGSHASSNIAETLNGGNDDDTVRGNAGPDTLNGDDGNDLLLGGGGNDTMNGGPGGDEMLGGTGGDTMNGDGGRDFMGGGDGNDAMDGGLGGDIMCGEAEVGGGGDTLNDGDTVNEGAGLTDELWSATAADAAVCQDDTGTKWDGNASTATCNVTPNPTISAKPAACP